MVNGESSFNDGGTVYGVVPAAGQVTVVPNGTPYVLPKDSAEELLAALADVKAGKGPVDFQVGPTASGTAWHVAVGNGADAGKFVIQPVTSASNAAYAISPSGWDVFIAAVKVALDFA